MTTITKKITNLALCGGGFYGYAEVGALMELENYKEFLNINDIRGVSVGSIVAALYAVGYCPTELTKVLFSLNFDILIKDNSLPYLRLYEKFGMYDAIKLEEEIERLIREKTHIKNCTFSQIKINLTIISTNLNYQRPKFFNKDETPDMIISKAVRMSIGYPLIMSPVKYEGDLYGDGGEFMNYPITTFADLDTTIGITFASHNENINGTLKNRVNIVNIYDYIRTLALTMNRAAYVSQVTDKYLSRSIVIQITQDINSMQFNLTNEQKHFLYNCGVTAVRDQIGKIIGNTDVHRTHHLTHKIKTVADFVQIISDPIADIPNIEIDNDTYKETILEKEHSLFQNIIESGKETVIKEIINDVVSHAMDKLI